ncbi:hypothetical protein ACFX13_003443 [Malus domestica]|uniref:Uncharacterized protein n=1 Tax=Malus domestica TaxID=3750 RepID=A0A498IYW2_MALDO|nr:hypothetical protein DVH24_034415 [Malus domestica]
MKEIQQEMLSNRHARVPVSTSVAEADTSISTAQVKSSPVSVATVVATGDVQMAIPSGSSPLPFFGRKSQWREDFNNLSAQDFDSSVDGVPIQETLQEATDGVTGKKITDIAVEEKSVDREPITHENKLEAKDAFKALIQSTNIGSD